MIPILFVGSACFFANSSAGYEKASTIFIVSLLVAQVFGFITVWTRTFYATKFENPAVNDVPPNNP